MLIAVVLAFVGLGVFMTVMGIGFNRGVVASAGGTLALAIVCFAPAFGWGLWSRSVTCRRIREDAGLRYQRLCRIVEHPDAMARLPHRVIEHAVCGTFRVARIVRRLAQQVDSGHVVIVRRAGMRRFPHIEPMHIAFEPIHWGRDREREAWLRCFADPSLRAQMDAPGFDPASTREPQEVDPSESSESVEPGAQSKRMSWWLREGMARVMVCVTLLASIGFIIYLFVTSPKTCLLLVAGDALFIGYRALRRRPFYLVPGAVVFERVNLIGRFVGIRWLTPADTAIVANCPSFDVFFAQSGEKPIRAGRSIASSRELLVAWLSTARRPTPAQMETLLRGD